MINLCDEHVSSRTPDNIDSEPRATPESGVTIDRELERLGGATELAAALSQLIEAHDTRVRTDCVAWIRANKKGIRTQGIAGIASKELVLHRDSVDWSEETLELGKQLLAIRERFGAAVAPYLNAGERLYLAKELPHYTSSDNLPAPDIDQARALSYHNRGPSITYFRPEKTETGYQVHTPGLYTLDRRYTIGYCVQNFSSLDEASQFAEQAEKKFGEEARFQALSRIADSLDDNWQIEELPNGGYKTRCVEEGVVGAPGLQATMRLPAREVTHESIEDAERRFVKAFSQTGAGLGGSFLSFSFGGVSYRLTTLDEFSAIPRLSDTTTHLPDQLAAFISRKDDDILRNNSARTYQHTIRERNWRSQLFSFVKNYITSEGAPLANELGIQDLHILTPKQAMLLSTRLVAGLTKYDREVAEGKTKAVEADDQTALQVLKIGREKHLKSQYDAWKGSAVCRNMSCCVKAVFEALKANQDNINLLRDTYALYDSGTDYAPDPSGPGTYVFGETGHAWNVFATLGRYGVVLTVPDATWYASRAEAGDQSHARALQTVSRFMPSRYGLHRKHDNIETSYDKPMQDFFVRAINSATSTRERIFYAQKAAEFVTFIDSEIDPRLVTQLLEEINSAPREFRLGVL
ncbi:MAG: hypothetical protein KDD42_07495, partial [Bdellovibrionales bacterium]|nr:hypothetical protein [Bdellovibrionales bacterium]